MGGQEGNRGYVYQGIVSIFTALSDDNWDKISVEYATPNDKVDIALVDKDGIVIKAIQVKSSVNLFAKLDVQTSILSLVKDVAASEYQLILIGNLQESANIFIKSVTKYYDNVMDKESKDSIRGFESHLKDRTIKIVILPFNEDHLMGIVRDSLNRFISSKGHTIEFDALEQLSLALLSLKMLLGTNGKQIDKNDYQSKMLSWLNTSTNGKLITGISPSALEVLTYDATLHEITSNLIAYGMIHNEGYENRKSSLLSKGELLIKKISSIELCSFQEVERTEKTDVFNFSKPVKAEIDDFTKNQTSESVKKFWGIDVFPEFFNVGNLTQDMMFAQITDPSYNGTKEEKLKHKLISTLMGIILMLEGLEYLVYIMKKVRIVPLCITNTSTTSDKNITVSISVRGKNYRIFDINTDVNGEDLEQLDAFADVLIDEEILECMFDVKPNSIIDIEPEPSLGPVPFVMPDIFGSRPVYKLGDLIMRLSDYQAEETPAGWTTYEISSLRPGESKWLSPYIFFIAEDEQIKLNYSILSDSSQSKKNGTIEVKIDN